MISKRIWDRGCSRSRPPLAVGLAGVLSTLFAPGRPGSRMRDAMSTGGTAAARRMLFLSDFPVFPRVARSSFCFSLGCPWASSFFCPSIGSAA